MATVVKTTFQFKRATAARWQELNLVLAAGEPGFELDKGRLKIGDGETPWNELKYLGGENCGGLTEDDVNQLIATQLKGIEKALAELSAKVDAASNPIVEVKTQSELPPTGAINMIYVVSDENATYRWDDINLLYYCVGRDYKEVQILYGGNATD